MKKRGIFAVHYPLKNMKKQFAPLFLSLALVACGSGSDSSSEKAKVELKDKNQEFSYAMGYDAGSALLGFREQSGKQDVIDIELIIRGFEDALRKNPSALGDKNARQVIGEFITAMQEEKMSGDLKQYEGVKKEGEDFLAQNKTKAGVTTTQSGLQYEVLKQGKGVKPALGDSAEVHYVGTLLNGTKFDSSVDRNETFWFQVSYGTVIDGWVEGVQLMNVGSKYKFYLPYALAYGERGAGADIPPYSTLVFEVELFSVKPAAK